VDKSFMKTNWIWTTRRRRGRPVLAWGRLTGNNCAWGL